MIFFHRLIDVGEFKPKGKKIKIKKGHESIFFYFSMPCLIYYYVLSILKGHETLLKYPVRI